LAQIHFLSGLMGMAGISRRRKRLPSSPVALYRWDFGEDFSGASERMSRHIQRTALWLFALALFCAALFALSMEGTLGSALSATREALHLHYAQNAGKVVLIYVLVYTAVGALCLPGTGLLNLTGAGLFGPWVGIAAICFSRAAGGSLACMSVRTLLRERVLRRYGSRLEAINKGFADQGAFYLFALRLIPGLPYPLTNVAMGLTPIRLSSFFWITLVGSVPGCLVTINAVQQLGTISSPADLLSLRLALSLALIGLLPLLLRRFLAALRIRSARATA
jgi:uncharacterized membrane protein YdjX (TVP38/TMEM64 family)